jgi:exodeoxyribonuclease VII large subunit
MYSRPQKPRVQQDIYSVSRLNTEVRFTLEKGFPLLWVQGEIGNLSTPASGHIYFNLKDHQSQVRCAMFRSKRNLLRFRPVEGDQVLVRARISLYEARGEFQLIIETMEAAGEGALRQALEALKQRLAAEGLFASERKKPLPAMPRRIGVITSPTGAAVRDVLTVLRRRFAAAEVIIYPIPVQGKEAPAAIVEMLQLANRRQECDVLVLTRGGGSLEDLMAFNDEQVCRHIARLDIPLVSAIGHEIDYTLADLAADQRAPTPSAAAELVSPEGDELRQQLDNLQHRLRARFSNRLHQMHQRLQAICQRLELSHPARRLQQQEQRLDELNGRLQRGIRLRQNKAQSDLQNRQNRLLARHPRQLLGQLSADLQRLAPRLALAGQQLISTRQQRLSACARELHAVSPLATLERGYAIAHTLPAGEIVRCAEQLQADDLLSLRFGQGTVEARVVKPDKTNNPSSLR